MRQRALVHVGGPAETGKPTFIEAMLQAGGGFILAARCIRDDMMRGRETSPKRHPEPRRCRAAGASGAVLFTFPRERGLRPRNCSGIWSSDE